MSDLEDRIRAEVTRQSDAYEPSADLAGRITARVTGRRNARRLAVAGMAAAVLVVAGAAAGLVASSGPDRTDTAPATTPATTRPAPATTAPAPTTTRPTTPTAPPPEEGTTSAPPATTTLPPVAALADGTPLDREGVGPIRAGMTLREAAAASGRTITPGDPIGPTSVCGEATVDGTAYHLYVTSSGDPGADPLDSVVQLVTGGQGTREGVVIGSTEDEVAALYGEPTRTIVPPYTLNGTGIYVYEDGDVAYQVTLDQSLHVVALASGFPTAYPEGCA